MAYQYSYESLEKIQQDSTDPSAPVHAPYNFVKLSNKVIADWEHAKDVSLDVPFKDGFYGEIVLELENKSPLVIGAEQQTATEDKEGFVQIFRTPDGLPAIPGSSIKGSIRSLFEVTAFGRMQRINQKRFSIRDLTTTAKEIYGDRMTEPVDGAFKPKAKGGWLKFNKGIWQITPCLYARVDHSQLKSYSNNSFWDCVPKSSAKDKYEKWGRNLKVAFDATDEEAQLHNGKTLIYRKVTTLGTGNNNGVFVFTGQTAPRCKDGKPKEGAKHMEFVFFNPLNQQLDVTELMPVFKQIHENSEEWDYWKQKTEIPIFYLQDQAGKVKSLGLAQMYKLPADFDTKEMVAHTSIDHNQTDLQIKEFDLASLIFGEVGKQPEKSLKGRISFGLAKYIGEKTPQIQQTSPTILSSPKASYAPSYVTQQKEKTTVTKLKGQTYAGYSATKEQPKPEIRGWKRYPARPNDMVGVQQIADQQKKNKSTHRILEVLAEGHKFECKVRVHNLKEFEIGALLWVLTHGQNSDLLHSIGMGKAFGFGQVAFKIKATCLTGNASQSFDLSTAIQAFENQMQQKQPGWGSSQQIKTVLAMANPQQATAFEGKLRHMMLSMREGNGFASRKKGKMVLADYPLPINVDLSKQTKQHALIARLQYEAGSDKLTATLPDGGKATANKAKELFSASPSEEVQAYFSHKDKRKKPANFEIEIEQLGNQNSITKIIAKVSNA